MLTGIDKAIARNGLVNQFGPLVGRLLVAAIFLWSGSGKIAGFAGTAGYMASKGIPLPEVLLVMTIVAEIGAGLFIVLGWKARLGALVLFLWMIPVTLLFHNFWDYPPDQQLIQTILFMKNLAMMGAMLLLMAHGPGPLSADRR
jgi:putative oxidoreductase